jgi:hypothetical protein
MGCEMSRTTQPKKIMLHFTNGSLHFDKRQDVESYRDELIEHVSTVAMAMYETTSEDSLRLLSELNRDLTNKLYMCMTALAESGTGGAV